MATWLDLLEDDRGLSAIYGDEVPSLTCVALHEISLHRDGPRVTLRFDLPEYPVHPPEKWLVNEFNVVQVQLMLIGVEDVSLQGLTRDPRVDLTLERDGQVIKTATQSGSTRLDIRAYAAMITSISAYRAEENNLES